MYLFFFLRLLIVIREINKIEELKKKEEKNLRFLLSNNKTRISTTVYNLNLSKKTRSKIEKK